MRDIIAPRLIVAMDYDNAADCVAMARRLSPEYCRLKVGKELFTAAGPALVEQLMNLGFDVFLDLKFHDIPNTTAGAVKAAAELGVWMVNVHASGGERMLVAARERLEQVRGSRPLLIGVTVLTSMDEAELRSLGVERTPEQQVLHLAQLSQRCGLDGVVCSAREATTLRNQLGPDFCLVTPGIRPEGSPADDQRRTMTPAEAIAAGSHYLVVGRPITRAEDPAATCRTMIESLV
ncbi:orotidine-5'-phosphate decarboxylase [Marinimicrobium sp. ABcell2]|uniref:orotidine-5'-phosphate decarboxylase n=1 Tax=Marinimicrobium sp. ABcell2 TaxID=3069751 RepID=UPI0027B06E3D|nr:orotidine-5'-phosphate decarboxylase [Marinimicrobium sp. ABcell2]MDQ2078056.1 orotidine-5'-phosphate decarboxylase [Marinimicrobium sp. ABcell2]